MREGKHFLKFCQRDLPWMLFWIGIFWVIGEIMQAIFMVLLFREDQTYGSLGSLLAFAGLLVGMLTRSNLQSQTQFRLAIAMGCTRRAYLFWNTVLVFLEGLVGLAVVLVLVRLENAVLAALLPTWTDELQIAAVFSNGWVLLACVGGLAALSLFQLFLTAMTNRFGMRAFAVLWLVIWGGSMVLARSMDAAEAGNNTVLARFGRILVRFGSAVGWRGWVAVGVVAVLICAAVGVGMLRKAEIRL